MTTNDLYQAAIANREQSGEYYGVARATLEDGRVIICFVKPVAGRSIVKKHDRVDWSVIPVGEKYAKTISHKTAATLLR